MVLVVPFLKLLFSHSFTQLVKNISEMINYSGRSVKKEGYNKLSRINYRLFLWLMKVEKLLHILLQDPFIVRMAQRTFLVNIKLMCYL